MLNIGEVRMHHVFAHVLAGHVINELHQWIVNRHWLGHQIDDLTGIPHLAKGKHLDETQKVAGVFAAN